MTAIVALALTLGVFVAQAPDPRTEAERLAASGAYEEALKRFQAIAAANPDDIPARLWIGRLHLRMKQPRRAVSVFESIVATDERNVEALSGLGVALVDAGQWTQAADVLDRAEAIAPDRVDVIAAQGRRHAAAGRATLALAYYGKALAVDPSNTEIRSLSDALKASRAHRVSVGYNFQRFDPADIDFNAGTFEVNARLNDALRVFGAGELLRSRDTDEGRGGGGVEWLAHPRIVIRGGGLFGGDVWLPSTDVFGEATLRAGRARWSARVRFFDFDGADLWMAGPGLSFDATPRLTLTAEYLRGSLHFERPFSMDGDQSIVSDNFVLGAHGRPTDRVGAFIEYRHGIDRLDWMTADRLTAEDANTIGFGASVDVTPFFGLSGSYDYQNRSEGGNVHRGRGALTVRF
jgi:tetratricopeptide (TPR) repeat protein